MTNAQRWIRALDDLAFRAERALVVLLVAIMAIAVFLDAMHRVFAAGEGRIERLVVALVSPAGEAAARAWIAPAVVGGLCFGAIYLAARTLEKTAAPVGRMRALAYATAGTAIAAGLVRALVVGMPSGLPWSQQLALCAMLWVGFLGASIAARQRAHLALEVAQKIWPARLRPVADWLARGSACAFSVFLAALAVGFAHFHYCEWAESEGAAGLFEGFAVPRFLVFGFLPLPLVTMGLRFLVHGVEPAQDLGLRPEQQETAP